MVPVRSPRNQLLDPDPFVSTRGTGTIETVIDHDFPLNLHHFHDLNLNGLRLLVARLLVTRLLDDDRLLSPIMELRMMPTNATIIEVNPNMVAPATALDMKSEAGAEVRVLDMQTEATSTDGHRRPGVSHPLCAGSSRSESEQKHPDNKSED